MRLILILLLLTSSFSVWGQQPNFDAADALKRARELRDELHRRLIDHLQNGKGSTDDIFKDMEGLFGDLMTEMGTVGQVGPKNFDMAWTESKIGRTLLISPHKKDQRLEINVEKEMITIKGKTEMKHAQGSVFSNFSNSYSVPQDCDSGKLKMMEKDGKILMVFPYKVSIRKEAPVKPEKEQRKPIPPSEDDVTI